MYGVQWHPEVKHSEFGQRVLENFLHKAAGIPADWNSANVIDEQVARIARRSAPARVIVGLSGGVDSAVAAAIVHKAVGDQLTAIFVDHGLLRQDERRQVEEDYVASTGVRLVTVDAVDQFLDALAGVTDPEQSARSSAASSSARSRPPLKPSCWEASAEGAKINFLVQGTLYPDVVEWRGHRHRQHQEPPQRRRPARRPPVRRSSSRCAPSSRTRCARSAASSACPR